MEFEKELCKIGYNKLSFKECLIYLNQDKNESRRRFRSIERTKKLDLFKKFFQLLVTSLRDLVRLKIDPNFSSILYI